MVANTVGAGVFTLQEAVWEDQRLRLKFSFQRSKYAPYRTGTLGANTLQSLFVDYNGQTQWLSANLCSLTRIKALPEWLNLDLGYSANGMLGDTKNPEYYRGNKLPEFQRYRQWLLSPDVDLSKIKTHKKALRTVLDVLNIIKVPAPALELNGKEGLTWHWLYF